MPIIDQYFNVLVSGNGSDLHLSEGQPPKARVHGAISPIADGVLTHDVLKNMLSEICDPRAFERFPEYRISVRKQG
ncbi:MAG: type IV pili twitching motility protein PilT, partial [Verrucomicrobiota bacterium]